MRHWLSLDLRKVLVNCDTVNIFCRLFELFFYQITRDDNLQISALLT